MPDIIKRTRNYLAALNQDARQRDGAQLLWALVEEVERLRVVVQEVRDDAAEMPEDLKDSFLGSLPEQRKAWWDNYQAETDQLLNGAAKAAGD